LVRAGILGIKRQRQEHYGGAEGRSERPPLAVFEIDLSVTGRKSGRTISQPVWFVFDDDKLYLLPVRGSDTQWYKNVLKNPAIRIAARDAEAEFNAVPIRDAKRVASVVEKFRAKYGAGDVKRYYSKFDVAVVARMG
jgi:deazaflavin-dependent oxidoreductase (nitroreductase family)